MKTHSKTKRGAPHKRRRTSHRSQPAMPKFAPAKEEGKPETFTEMETGQPDHQESETRGPLGEEGEGDRQNDQLAELNEIEPEEE